jgi:hypothetical protein
MIHTYESRTWGVEARGSWVWDHPGLHRKFWASLGYTMRPCLKKLWKNASHQGVTPVIPATQETENRRVTAGSQSRQIVIETLAQENSSPKRAGGVAQGIGPEFKPQHWKKNEKIAVVDGLHLQSQHLEAKEGGLWVQVHPGLHNKTLSQKNFP